jgi:hypothetical protein
MPLRFSRSVTMLLAGALCCAPYPAIAASVEVMAVLAVLPDSFFRSKLQKAIAEIWFKVPGRLAFFGDVGPTAGCEELRRIQGDILTRDAARFRPLYIGAVDATYGPQLMGGMPPSLIMAQTDIYDARVFAEIARHSPIAADGAKEMLDRAERWALAQGYKGRRLGYDRAGMPYWGTNVGAPNLVCAYPPAMRAGVLGNWRKE